MVIRLGRWIKMMVRMRLLRSAYLSFKKIGCNVRFDEPPIVEFPDHVELGNNVLFHRGAYINGEGGVTIGDNFVASFNSMIISSSHNFDKPTMLPWDDSNIPGKVVIDDNVWCGVNVTILPGVHVGEGAVIGAGAVVTADVEPCAVIGGNPAKVIKYRDKETYFKLKKEGKFHKFIQLQTTNDRVLKRK
jgi:acetyltransferase-like isoleucine patch superfamily enzyme